MGANRPGHGGAGWFRNLQLVVDALSANLDVIGMLVVVLGVLLVVAGTVVYYVEGALVKDTWFDSIPLTMYYMHGADPWVGDRLLCRSALHIAARHNQPDCLEAILTSPFMEFTGKVRSRECNSAHHYTRSKSQLKPPLSPQYTCPCWWTTQTAQVTHHSITPPLHDRGSTPLHAAARFQNLELAMILLKHWDENLRRLDVTDPRVVESYDHTKPYQMPDVKPNKALMRVLDPGTPIKEISDPFGDAAATAAAARLPYDVSCSKVAPMKKPSATALKRSFSPQGQEPEPLTLDGDCGQDDDKVPAGWEDVLSGKSGIGTTGKAAGGDFITIYHSFQILAHQLAVIPRRGPARLRHYDLARLLPAGAHSVLDCVYTVSAGWQKPGEVIVSQAGWASPGYDRELMCKYLEGAVTSAVTVGSSKARCCRLLLVSMYTVSAGWQKPGEVIVSQAGWASPGYDRELMCKYLEGAVTSAVTVGSSKARCCRLLLVSMVRIGAQFKGTGCRAGPSCTGPVG
ncbi:hypothetical protein VOLCADRAFT_103202 [Volvox carteri f. nagariensis]|uniref:Uncharacterized protein n=1 Tax=Volvox carteri f. nagariensis TaxID=3068 RepID=D8TK48_VOLCA|nr:uncharacterized protein VOLCADRAFT_103202 [Volvox carteri f. nagariensis]EFJ52185.1 hypothetical protein VOLCADRAFT_103202 [Volvox carteri f. nagariensis]|eukprot:XP_002946959.1 hypothetical protein VOLCADRAFT_103202 [Volvox carteri f. nagariensis]